MPCLTQHTERKRENDESFLRKCGEKSLGAMLWNFASACISFKFFLRFAFKTNSPECESFCLKIREDLSRIDCPY